MPNPAVQDVHVNRPLTNMSVAYFQSAENFVADKVFPPIPVTKQSDRYFVYDKGDFFRSEMENRAPGTESAGGGYRLDSTPTYFCHKKSVHKDIDDDTRANSDEPLNQDRDATIWVTQQGLIKRDIDWAAAYFGTGKWGTDLAGVTGTPTAGQFKRWDETASDPISDLADESVAIESKTGYLPNTLVLSPRVYNALRNNAAVLDRIKYTQKGQITREMLASLFDLERVLVARGVQNTGPEEGTDAIDYIVNTKGALLVYSAPSPSLQMPSGGYTFTWTGLLGAGAHGGRIKKFRMDHLDSDRIEIDMAYDQKLVAADVGSFFNDAIS
jgi:Phage major capsid protein E